MVTFYQSAYGGCTDRCVTVLSASNTESTKMDPTFQPGTASMPSSKVEISVQCR